MEIDKNSRGTHRSLLGKEYLFDDLIGWLRSKNLSVCQARDLLEDVSGLIDDAWHTEKKNTKL
ncbi:MAG: hypothetical protein J6C19_02380 [Lachnospiraceae bacterium]|nr:hypothetical protein [Lachnospiraceae bacterium]MBO5144366.1 hypothetical protein [Lachnospiraceae bacterium]